MHWINWLIVVVYLVYVVTDGLRRAKGTRHIEGYFLANRDLPWWAVGLSVMATQLSAVTMIGTTGQGATDGMRFVQFYFGLPVAMVILGVTLVPFLHRARVYTAYEYLERRFDAKTRSLTSFLFLVSRAMSCGAIISAPGIVFSAIFGWPLLWSVALMGIPTVIYTMFGGVQAVTWADVKQMILIVGALFVIVIILVMQLPVSPDQALRVAGAAGRVQVFDFDFDLTKQYTFWSGIIGGTFLMLSYFGTDQSQVQRYLTARSVEEARSSLLMSAYWKIPLQALILLIGVLIFVFYLFQPAPMLFNPSHDQRVRAADPAGYAILEERYRASFETRRDAATALAGTPGDDAIGARMFVAAEDRGAGEGRGGDARADARRELRHAALRAESPPVRHGRHLHRRGDGGCHVVDRRRAQLAVDGYGHRLLSAMVQAAGHRCALPDGLEGGDGFLGYFRLSHRGAGWIAGLIDRGREPVWLVLLWLDPRCLPAGDDSTRARDRSLLGPHWGHGGGGRGFEIRARGCIPLA
jgi:SSS family transporter